MHSSMYFGKSDVPSSFMLRWLSLSLVLQILYRPVISFSAVCDFDGRLVLAEFALRDSFFRVACCYAPNSNPDRDAFFHHCIDSIDPSIPNLLCCEFNTVHDRFVDPHRSCWVPVPLDFFCFFCRHATLPHTLTTLRLIYLGPFHPLPTPAPPDSGFWKLNCSILEEEDYFKLISDFWFSWRQRRQHFSSLLDWWDAGRSRIKKLTLNYSRHRNSSKSFERSLLSYLPSHLKPLVGSGRSSL